MLPDSRGTSFFLDFAPGCQSHQIEGSKGERIREEIEELLLTRFLELFREAFKGKRCPPISQLRKIIAVHISRWGDPSMNHGEIYLWLRGIHLDEDFVFKFLRELKDSLEEDPIVAKIDGEDYPLWFYGWGFRYV